MMRIAVVGALVAFAVLGCGGGTSAEDAAQAVTSKVCVAMPDASANGCGATRAYLSCVDPKGDGLGCPADDPMQTQCASNGGPSVGGGPWTCHDQCNATEYSLSCGGIGPNAPPSNPPAACRGVAATPAGIYFLCCPCGA